MMWQKGYAHQRNCLEASEDLNTYKLFSKIDIKNVIHSSQEFAGHLQKIIKQV